MRSRLLYLTVVLFALVAILFLGSDLTASIPPKLITVFRAIALASFFAYAVLRRSLTTWIVFSMFLGAEIGYDFPAFASNLRVLSQIFLQLIRTIIAPLLFGTLVSGIAGHANLKAVGRMGVKAILYFEIVTTVALVIGLTAINVSKAGVGVQMPSQAATQPVPAARPTPTDMILHIFPENIAKAISEGQVLQVVVFSMIFGIALAQVREERRRPMLAFAESLTEVMFKFTNIVMLFAPIGVGAAVAYTIGHMGVGVLLNLAKLLATLYAALAIFLLGVLLPIAWFAGVPLRKFLSAIAEPASIAFGTSNSEAALPLAMEAMERIGVPRQVVAFVMPLGYSFNLDGSSLYLSLGAIFVAQVAGVHLSIGQQVVLLLTLMLASKGVAGVSRASVIILMGTVGSFGLPVEPVFILLGIDQLMDMARTSVNVIGNCLATVVVARWEGEFPSADRVAQSAAHPSGGENSPQTTSH
jgi:proton glutamate symport protein